MGVTWREHLRAAAAIRAVVRSPPPEPRAGADVVLTLNAFRRPDNVPLIVHLALATPSVREVFISHNDPSIPLPLPPHPRVRVFGRGGSYGPLGRYLVARESDAERFLSIDDDVFLHPTQLEQLVRASRRDPSVPHGFYGQLFDGERYHHNRGRSDGRVDVLNRAYAFTRAHLDRYFELLDALGFEEGARRALTMDDVVLTFCAEARPKMHDLGPHVDCPTERDAAIAIFPKAGQGGRRAALFRRLARISPVRREGPDARELRDPLSPRWMPLP